MALTTGVFSRQGSNPAHSSNLARGTAPGVGQRPDLEIARLISDLFPGSHFQEVDGADA